MSSASSKIAGVVGRPDNLLWVDPMAVTIEPGENPRDEDLALDDLKPLIKAHGFRLDCPISVYKDDDGTLKLINGQRRLLSVRELVAEGEVIPRIPAILLPRMADPVERLLSALSANRGKNLTPGEEGRAFNRLVNLGWTLDRIGQAVGHSVNYVRGRLDFLEAKPAVVEAQKNGDIGLGDAVRVVRQAEKNGTTQAQELATVTMDKATRKVREPRAKDDREAILQAIIRLEERYGTELVRATLVEYAWIPQAETASRPVVSLAVLAEQIEAGC